MTNKDHIERTKRMIEVMQAYVDGEKIEYKAYDDVWIDKPDIFGWQVNVDYRIAKTPDTINWDHVSTEFNYMARDEDGFGYLYKVKPTIKINSWECNSRVAKIDHFSSYRKGTVDWKDSLVIRPGCE